MYAWLVHGTDPTAYERNDEKKGNTMVTIPYLLLLLFGPQTFIPPSPLPVSVSLVYHVMNQSPFSKKKKNKLDI